MRPPHRLPRASAFCSGCAGVYPAEERGYSPQPHKSLTDLPTAGRLKHAAQLLTETNYLAK